MGSQRHCELIDNISWKFQKGKRNAIIDVHNIKVGQLTISRDVLDETGTKIKIRTGLTAVFPGDIRKEDRYFMDFLQLKGGNEISGYQVVEDFKYLNSPLVLSNIHNLGTVYNAILSHGFQLGRSEIWPPVVLSIDDSILDGSNSATVVESDILKLLENATNRSVEEGSVGIGTGLRAYGWKGGIGSSSRMFLIDGQQFSIGALVATNWGPGWESIDGTDRTDAERNTLNRAGSLTLILGTDVPLLPYQIKRIVTGIVMSLPSDKFGSVNNGSILCVLFSVSNSMTLIDDGPEVFEYTLPGDVILMKVEQAGSEAAKEAILRSICLSKSMDGRSGRILRTMPEKQFLSVLYKFEETV